MAGRTEKWSATRQLALLDLKPGDVIQHTPGRTITEFDDVFATLLCVNRAPLHIDANYSEKTAQGQRIVNGLFITAIAMGVAHRDFRPIEPVADEPVVEAPAPKAEDGQLKLF